MNVQSAIHMLPTEEAAKLRSRGPLPSKPYHDPAWYELERRAIFMRSWLHIGHVCEIPDAGSFILRDMADFEAKMARQSRLAFTAGIGKWVCW